MALKPMKIVVKVGTSTLTYETGKLNLKLIEKLVRVLSDLKNSGHSVVLVSSGAIAVGASKLGLTEKPQSIAGKQAAAAVGQSELMFLYDKLFSEYGHTVAQMLLTRDVFEEESSRSHAANTLEALLSMGAIPIINENDTVSVEELIMGDNDTLSALVAELSGANLLVMLTDMDGLYDADPREQPDAKLISVVECITTEIREIAGGAGSKNGTGGMITKLVAAEICCRAGIEAVISNGSRPEDLYGIIEGKNIGTRFLPSKTA